MDAMDGMGGMKSGEAERHRNEGRHGRTCQTGEESRVTH
jgi:hypothetical protein